MTQWISQPKQPRPFHIREEQHPLLPNASVFRVYEIDGRPLYIGEETVEEAEARLRSFEMVTEVTVIYRESGNDSTKIPESTQSKQSEGKE